MDDTLSRNLTQGYSQLQDSARLCDNPHDISSSGRHHPRHRQSAFAPRDPCNCIYLALVLCGAGFLLPYNSFITAVDYYHERFPGTTIVFDMSMTYICVAFLSVCVINLLVETFSLKIRITLGYILSFFTLLLVVLCDVWFEMFTRDTSYSVTLAAVAVVAFGSTAQQSSFYGYTSMLPRRYTQAVMTGESAAGLIISLNRILTKAILHDQKLNTVIFFGISLFTVLGCFVVFHVTQKSDFVKYYVNQCKQSVETEDRRELTDVSAHACPEEMDINDRDQASNTYGVLEIKSPTSPSSQYQQFRVSYRTDDYGVVNRSPASVSEVPPIRTRGIAFRGRDHVSCIGTWNAIKYGATLRWRASRAVWPYMFAIALAYFVTLCLFPGIESEIISCSLGSWMPILLMAIFNLFDFIGKILASIPVEWSRGRLVSLTCLRFMLVPLMMLCATPRMRPMLGGEGWSFILSLLLGLTNGYFGSVPMILAPTKVPEEQKELTGNIMMLSYTAGLTAGSGIAYALDVFLGPALRYNPCTPLFVNTTYLMHISNSTRL